MKEKRGWRQVEEFKRVKVELNQDAEEPRLMSPEREWKIQVRTKKGDNWTSTSLMAQLENELYEIVELAYNVKAEEIEVTLKKDMYTKGSFLDQRQWFTKSITRITNLVPALCLKCKNEGDVRFLEEIVSNVQYIYQCDMGITEEINNTRMVKNVL